MTLRWSWALYGLLIIPVIVAVYLWQLRRKRKFAVRYASLSLIREAMPGRSRWRRYLPPALLLLSIVSLVIAVSRPQIIRSVARSRTSIMLTLDVSRSMCATDVDPNRLTAAQRAATEFVQHQPKVLRIGIVAFAGSAQLLVPPTTDTKRLLQAIDGLTTSGGTGIGNAILTSIDALAEINPNIAPSTQAVPKRAVGPSSRQHVPDIVVVLTDGANTIGLDPRKAATQAADRKVRVYTIGFGTTNPGSFVCTSQQLGADAFGGDPGGGGVFGGGGGGFRPDPGGFSRRIDIDEPTLKAIAATTDGTYHRAQNANQLTKVFRDLPKQIQVQQEQNEISVLFVALGTALALMAMGLSLWWNRYP
ncbi:MAG: hypothetical protein JWL73_1479 [Actinomycetia bacterium]|nr:hypothetical protein [Actinomycetes bacterium]